MRQRAGALPQSEKLVPQPHEAVALGLWTLKDWPIRSSTKSISEPRQVFERDRVDQHARACPLDHEVVGLGGADQVELVLEARAAAALDADAQQGRGGLAGDDLGDAARGALGDGDGLAHGRAVAVSPIDLPVRSRRWR